jgi:hypothetical protein
MMNLKSLKVKYRNDKKEVKIRVRNNLHLYVKQKYGLDCVCAMHSNKKGKMSTIEFEVDNGNERLNMLLQVSTVILYIRLLVSLYSSNSNSKVCYDSAGFYRTDKNTVINAINASSFSHLTSVITKFIDKHSDIGRDIFNHYKLLCETDYLHNLPKATTFYLCSKIFPRDISKIIYKKILFFLPTKN